MGEGKFYHEPVLSRQVIDYLVQSPEGVYLDCTVGGGGHAEEILKRLNNNGFLIGIDADADALAFARERLQRFSNVALQQIFYDQLDVVLVRLEKYPVEGVLFDLGISSFQVDCGERGFSYLKEGPLDMRFHPTQRLTAEHVVNEYSEEELGRVLREYGEEPHWRRLTRAIVEARQSHPIQTTEQLAAIIRTRVPQRFQIKTLARVFQAIRIEVNDELNRLKRALEKAFRALQQHGRLVVISYHSLEDRIVKDFFRYKASDCICPPEWPQCRCDKVPEMKILTRKPLRPSPEEVRTNPRARSARLRVAEKIVPFEEI